jgi:hypothetical protein
VRHDAVGKPPFSATHSGCRTSVLRRPRAEKLITQEKRKYIAATDWLRFCMCPMELHEWGEPSKLQKRLKQPSTRGGSRTHTPVRTQDFESSASAIPPLQNPALFLSFTAYFASISRVSVQVTLFSYCIRCGLIVPLFATDLPRVKSPFDGSMVKAVDPPFVASPLPTVGSLRSPNSGHRVRPMM